MVDIVSKEKRSQMMSGIQGKNTKPENLLRKELFARGFRYKLHEKKLPGKPDMVLPKYGAVIFIQGCFWHGHGCHLFKWPQSNVEFWKDKIGSNIARDEKSIQALKSSGYRVLLVWECALKGKTKRILDDLVDEVVDWIRSDLDFEVIEGIERVQPPTTKKGHAASGGPEALC